MQPPLMDACLLPAVALSLFLRHPHRPTWPVAELRGCLFANNRAYLLCSVMLAGSLASLKQLSLLSSRGQGISGVSSHLRLCVHRQCSKAAFRPYLRGLSSIIAQSSPVTTATTDKMTDANGSGPVTAEEVEALRKQVEDLKVHLYFSARKIR